MRRLSQTLSCTLMCIAPIAAAHDVVVSPVVGALPLEQLTENVYVVHGPVQAPNPDNGGFMNNPGFIITQGGVVVVDPGSSVQIGAAVLGKVAGVTDKPVIAVFNTHVHGDHWLGNQAIKQAYPDAVIYAHERMLERVAESEGESWIRILDDLTGGAIKGTVVTAPDVGLAGGETLDFGNTAIQVHFKGKAHSDNDLLVEIDQERTLFMGDVGMVTRITSQHTDGDVRGHIETLKFILETDNEVFIPGHGKSGGKEVPRLALSFHQALYDSVKRHYEAGLSDFEMKDEVIEDLAAFKDWDNFDDIGRAISHAYLRVEQDLF
jgi:glyoxylase-like metal-dependent hydrolase (beta-lactamase superfamily II)